MIPSLPGLPPLHWTGAAGEASIDDASGALTLRAARGVDWTNDSTGGPWQHAASALAFPVADADFVLSARVRVLAARSTFDAGALVLWSGVDRWAKLCNENSPQGEPMVVSVVTNGFSDDANGPFISGDAVFLRIARAGAAYAFHFSVDGRDWHFVRLFRLDADPAGVAVGFLAQAPMGDDARAVFDSIDFARRSLTDLRDLT